MNNDQALLYMDAERLTEIATDLLHAGGYTLAEAKITAQSLVLSNLMGHDSHGVVRIATYLQELTKGITVSNAGLSILNETDNSCHADGEAALGQVQMPAFLDILLEKGKTQACVTGAMKNCGHIGRVGEWSERIAHAGYAAMITVNDNGAYRIVAPPGGKEACTSTNPIAFGIPLQNNEIFSFDMSTSAIAAGKVHLLHLTGQDCAPGLVQNNQGKATTNPGVLFEDPVGALLPMGGAQSYKGFGLSMIVDFLTAGLSGGFTPPASENTPLLNNVVVTIWNPAHFSGLEHMALQAEKYIGHLRTIPPTDIENPIRIAGDRANSIKKNRLKTGIPLDKSLCERLAKSANMNAIDIADEITCFLRETNK